MDSKEFNHKIIALVKKNVITWNWDRKNDKHKHEEAWKQIAKRIGRSVRECKKRWQGLRDRFGRLNKEDDVNWIHYNELIFLKNVIKRRGRKNIIFENKINLEGLDKEVETVIEECDENEFTENTNDDFGSENLIECNSNHEEIKEELFQVEEYIDDESSKLKSVGIKYGEIFFYENIFFYFCSLCNKLFESNDLFITHCVYKHLEETSKIHTKEDDSKISINSIEEFIDTSIESNEDDNLNNKCELQASQISTISSSDENDEISKGDLNFKCPLCSYNTTTLKIFLSHGEENHPGEAIFKCFKCPQIFENYNLLLDHKSKCEKYSNFRCNLCDKNFKSKKNLRQHTMIDNCDENSKLSEKNSQNVKFLGGESYFKCAFCNFETLEKEYYIEHCFSEHPNELALKCDDVKKDDSTTGRLHREVLKCGACEFETQVINIFLDHSEEHISKGETPFKCWFCGKIFKKYRYLIYHRRLHRRLNDSACSFCGKQFHTYRSLRDHERGHTGQRTIYRCQYCSKEFGYSETLRDHENIHTGNRPYKCTYCDRDFSLKSTWQTHIRVKHLDDKRFECKVCGLKCLKRRDALEHEASHSGNKLYICDICGNTYSKNSALMSHLKSHANLRNYKCKICGKGFNTATNLSRHMWVHSEERNWECELCGNKFVCNKNLKQHMETHYKNNILYSCEGCEKIFRTKSEFESHNCSNSN